MAMKIGIIAPSPVPFVAGGAENLYGSLHAYLNGQTRHDAEMVKLASPEADFWGLMDSYRAFSELDVSRFDLVISTKYPSWMIDHPKHVCYMLHCLRGVYDTYESFGLPFDAEGRLPSELSRLRTRMQRPLSDRKELAAFFEHVFQLRGNGECEVHLGFPGPLTRQIIHYLDSFALRRGNVERHAAISQTVARRPGYFPEDVAVQVAYPESGLRNLRGGRYDYFFTASRLDAPKRIDLIVEGFRRAGSDARLKIAGTGPEEDRLRRLAASDARIDFLGYVNETELVDFYANARAVIFTPYDEDLGYITIEAMLSGKPVITVADAGGPLEFVRDGVNGYVCQPDPDSLAVAIERIAQDDSLARNLGACARSTVKDISWETALSVLMGEGMPGADVALLPRRKRIVLLSTFPIFPPTGGGQCRIFHLWRQVARSHDVTVVSSMSADGIASEEWIAENMREVRVPRTSAQQDYETELSRSLGWLPVTDIAFALSPELGSTYRAACESALEGADLCVVSHPYAFPILDGMALPELWYEAHNHEGSMKDGILPNTDAGRRVSSQIHEVERLACLAAEKVICVSLADRELLRGTYGIPLERMLMIPNGVDLDSVTFHSHSRRLGLRNRLSLGSHRIAVMLASWHGPNLEAVEDVLELAGHFQGVDFVVIGSACNAISGRELPSNVHLVGVVSDEEKDIILGAASVALNPMRSGGGSNLKLLDYMASGVPVVTSEFGARGADVSDNMVWIYRCREDLSETFARAISADMSQIESKTTSARRHVERNFAWEVLSRIVDRTLCAAVLQKEGSTR